MVKSIFASKTFYLGLLQAAAGVLTYLTASTVIPAQYQPLLLVISGAVTIVLRVFTDQPVSVP